MTADPIAAGVEVSADAVEALKRLRAAQRKTDKVFKSVRRAMLGALEGAFEIGKALEAERAAYDAYVAAVRMA